MMRAYAPYAAVLCFLFACFNLADSPMGVFLATVSLTAGVALVVYRNS